MPTLMDNLLDGICPRCGGQLKEVGSIGDIVVQLVVLCTVCKERHAVEPDEARRRLWARGIDPTPAAIFRELRGRHWWYRALGGGDIIFQHEVEVAIGPGGVDRISHSIQDTFTEALVCAFCLALERKPGTNTR